MKILRMKNWRKKKMARIEEEEEVEEEEKVVEKIELKEIQPELATEVPKNALVVRKLLKLTIFLYIYIYVLYIYNNTKGFYIKTLIVKIIK